ncbi:hypothetical protein PYCCODRAFT_1163388 [Trametes coccinea BRFM310]|uniref:Uncharacterized protein n=1 Tax=Trametes coccinea (strain BRFM310) TaxID=1353009 RepID=A0A1Y2IX21_TRAC3|nr:hypothetical protein PYCCODRAFT_1163388 [Trametes coccinea BRFM310]
MNALFASTASTDSTTLNERATLSSNMGGGGPPRGTASGGASELWCFAHLGPIESSYVSAGDKHPLLDAPRPLPRLALPCAASGALNRRRRRSAENASVKVCHRLCGIARDEAQYRASVRRVRLYFLVLASGLHRCDPSRIDRPVAADSEGDIRTRSFPPSIIYACCLMNSAAPLHPFAGRTIRRPRPSLREAGSRRPVAAWHEQRRRER